MPTTVSSSLSTSARPLRVGFLALTDAAPLIIAEHRGLFEHRGLQVELRREVGWATIRDKVLYGEIDAAQAPAPMLWAAQLGLGCGRTDVCTGFIFNLHGNAITLSTRLWADGVRDMAALHEEALRRRGEHKLTFGIVFEHSMHHVLLRQWLRAARLDPDRDVRIAVVPPAQMFRNLVAGTLDGYCAGEPWNTLAVQQGGGWCPTWSAALSPGHVEKVLLVRSGFATRYVDEHRRLIRALIEAARWCDEPRNRAELAQILSAPAYLDLPAAVIAPSLLGQFSPHLGRIESVPDFHVFNKGDANVPTQARAATLQAELVAAGLVPRAQLTTGLPRNLFREDLYRQALTQPDTHANSTQPSDGAFLPA